MGAYDPRIAQPGQTQVNLPNGFAPQPAMTNGFAQQGPAPMPPQPNPMRQTVPQPGIPQGPMPGQPAPNPMLAGADMQQPGMPSMLDRLMSPAGQIGLSMMAQGPSLRPVNPLAGIGTALSNSMQYQRQKQADALAAETRRKEEIAAKRAAEIAEEEWKWKKADRAAGQQAAARQRAFWEEVGMPGMADAPAEMQEAAIKQIVGDPEAKKTQFTQANQLRDDFRGDTELVRKVYEGSQVIDALKERDHGISDRALIIAFSKIMDPNSAVLENEAQAVANAAGKVPALAQSIMAAFGQGGSLKEETRREIARVAAVQANARLREAAPIYARYEQMADRYGVPWQDVNVFGDITAKDLEAYNLDVSGYDGSGMTSTNLGTGGRAVGGNVPAGNSPGWMSPYMREGASIQPTQEFILDEDDM